MDELVFVTGNKQKAQEAQEILGYPIKVVQLDIDEIQSLSLQEVATKKAQAAFEKLQKPLFVDDVGLYLDVWEGFPGPFVKFVGRNEVLLKMLGEEENRNVLARGVIAYHDSRTIHTFLGEVRGQIAKEFHGEGMGWDPMFIPQGYKKTWAELGAEVKNSHSHRRKALDQFKKFLSDQEKK